ncbi:glycosyltransferase family 2 protein [Acinetobacter pittii]|uniref:glycosyltransferase family 2 protein n=1 Tax=Acinetobacter pittii TaxID=48296 RepID=UPI00202F9106|nr:glycosyltransferase family 2 protein [Acinetobacter pittii]MCM1963674.1 glycosyltransferase family 2 protein [Acinetobacter pittii]MCM1980004.1 glycosyltransferase family 2 protein [Acinetobacter pittii]
MSSLSNVWAIIVTFNPSLENVKKLVKQLSIQSVIPCIVDNCSTNVDSAQLKNIHEAKSIFLEKNYGIATAQNKGIEFAIENGADYILFFDQDSSIPDGYVQALYSDYQYLQGQGEKVSAIGPRFIDDRYNFYYKTISVTKSGFREKHDVSQITKPLHSTLLISSGSLISVETLKVVGLMRDYYFIDYVDTEWCLRAEYLGYKNFVSAQAVMRHTIGDNVLNLKFFNVPVHSAFRRYFRVRNAFFMMREPHVPSMLVVREMLFNGVHQIILICFEKNKWQYIKSYFRGLKDGLIMGQNKDV